MTGIVFERKFAMANRWTFLIPPIKAFVYENITDGYWVDPFAGRYSPATVTNDLNIECPTDYHEDALTFLRRFDNSSVDGVFFDPPYSPRQVSECYNGIDGSIKWDGRMSFWSNAKNECARILKPGGRVMCFGWNSMGLGLKRGFRMERILMVTHGGSRNDTICTLETKI